MKFSELLTQKWHILGLEGEVLIDNSINEKDEMPRDEIEAVIEQAVFEMTISGCDVTPYLLTKVTKLTEVKSKVCNMTLLKNNAALAAKIAQESTNVT